mmetsp:Transcript_14594/g.32763  ORF Transcript_14594/g.32763 Transcript_14594/m.32763 type:complete len:216 (+) Transcript_14594:778-1425(+)
MCRTPLPHKLPSTPIWLPSPRLIASDRSTHALFPPLALLPFGARRALCALCALSLTRSRLSGGRHLGRVGLRRLQRISRCGLRRSPGLASEPRSHHPRVLAAEVDGGIADLLVHVINGIEQGLRQLDQECGDALAQLSRAGRANDHACIASPLGGPSERELSRRQAVLLGERRIAFCGQHHHRRAVPWLEVRVAAMARLAHALGGVLAACEVLAG